MTPRPAQPEPFVRGAPYPAAGDVPYPRANPTDTARLPSDTWHAAVVPAGVRLELVGDAEAIDVAYRTTSGNLGYRGDGAGITFSVWRAGRKVCEEEAVLGDGLIRLSLGGSAPDKPATIYLPEGMQPVVLSLTAVQGQISPAPDLPRWIAYGDSITQGWIASGPAQGWAAIAARKAGLDLVNLGYAAAGRGEIVSAEHIATLPADIISIAYGASCWTRVPHSVGLVAEGFSAFLDVVRDGHPDVPIVVVSPLLRPDAEDEPNRLGATLADIRGAIESVTRDRILDGDHTLALVAGESIINADHLGDGIHPDDEGHKRIAATVGKALALAMRAAEESPDADAMKAAAKSLGGGRMSRGRSSGDGDGDSAGDGELPGPGGGHHTGRGGRPAGRVRDSVKVGAGVGAGIAGADGDVAHGSGAHRLEVVDDVADEVADDVLDLDLEPVLTEDADVVVTEAGVTEVIEYEHEYGHEYGGLASDMDVDMEELVPELDVDVAVDDLVSELDVEELVSDVAVEDLEFDTHVEVLEVDTDVEVLEVESESESVSEPEADPGLTSQARVAGEYVYEEYVDYENDVEYRFVVTEVVTEHRNQVDDADDEPQGDVEPDAPAVDADVEVKRKGGGRKGRGVAASSSSR